MSDCTGFVTPAYTRDSIKGAKSKPCRVAISHPSTDWVQLTATYTGKTMRLSIPMEEFEKLVLKMDEVMGGRRDEVALPIRLDVSQ